jgi:hypothetical protein
VESRTRREELEMWKPIETAPKDGTFICIYWEIYSGGTPTYGHTGVFRWDDRECVNGWYDPHDDRAIPYTIDNDWYGDPIKHPDRHMTPLQWCELPNNFRDYYTYLAQCEADFNKEAQADGTT